MYRIKMCIGKPLNPASARRNDVVYKMYDMDVEFSTYRECKDYIEKLVEINKTENSAIDFWIADSKEGGV